MAEPVTITLTSINYPEVHFTSEHGQPGTQLEIEVGLFYHWHREDRSVFMVSMEMRANAQKDAGGGTVLHVKVMGHFQTNTIVDEAFREGPYVKINAPAIMYPFLRAFVGTFMMSAGYPMIALPSFDFTKPGIPMTDYYDQQKPTP